MILLQDVPDGYEYCFAGNGKCPKASSCLRAIAAQLLSESEGPQPQSVRAVNPFYVGSLSGSSTCARYRSSEQLHYARGMTRLFDEVPTKLLFTVRHRVMGCFSCERYYYHCRKGERPISPEEQQRIARVFKAVGIRVSRSKKGLENDKGRVSCGTPKYTEQNPPFSGGLIKQQL